jgi:hypothetical protein
MSIDEDLFLKEIKYDDRILDKEETVKYIEIKYDDSILDNEDTIKYIDNKRAMIKIANNEMSKKWLKKKNRHYR